MKTISVDTFSAFVSETESLCALGELFLFRGQAQRGNLLPRIARANPTENTESTEKKMLSELRRIGAAYLPQQDAGDWELMVIAQHFAMATRLLDWTSNPLAALWFACSSHEKGDCHVYVLEADTLLIPEEKQKSPFGVAKTRVFQPRLNNPRIVAQDGWFTAHRYANSNSRFLPLEKIGDIKGHLTELVIPEGSRTQMLKSLDRHGISSRALFPDLEGLCRYVSWKLAPA